MIIMLMIIITMLLLASFFNVVIVEVSLQENLCFKNDKKYRITVLLTFRISRSPGEQTGETDATISASWQTCNQKHMMEKCEEIRK